MPGAGSNSAPAEARAAFIRMTTEKMVGVTHMHAPRARALNEQIAVKTLGTRRKI